METQRQILLKFKMGILQQADRLGMPEERKSYLLHQLSNVHDLESFVDLVREINTLQLNQNLDPLF